MKKLIELDQVCDECAGTGLYVGFAENDGAAVVCHKCKGTGCYHFKLEYEEFEGIKKRRNVKRVFEVNVGIIIGSSHGHTLEEFGGMPYKDWKAGKEFGLGTEMRKYSCPLMWCQSAGKERSSQLEKHCEVCRGGRFSDCPLYEQKEDCWKFYDNENKN